MKKIAKVIEPMRYWLVASKFYKKNYHVGHLIAVLDAEVDDDVEDDDDEDEDDVAHEPDVDLLEVARLGKVLLDGGQQAGQHQQTRQSTHEPR